MNRVFQTQLFSLLFVAHKLTQVSIRVSRLSLVTEAVWLTQLANIQTSDFEMKLTVDAQPHFLSQTGSQSPQTCRTGSYMLTLASDKSHSRSVMTDQKPWLAR